MDEAAIQRNLVSQYLASLAMLRAAIESCPEDLWLGTDFRNRYWHIAYHTVFYTHFYVQAGEADFRPWIKHRPRTRRIRAIRVESELQLTIRELRSRGSGASLDVREGSMLAMTLLPGA